MLNTDFDHMSPTLRLFLATGCSDTIIRTVSKCCWRNHFLVNLLLILVSFTIFKNRSTTFQSCKNYTIHVNRLQQRSGVLHITKFPIMILYGGFVYQIKK